MSEQVMPGEEPQSVGRVGEYACPSCSRRYFHFGSGPVHRCEICKESLQATRWTPPVVQTTEMTMPAGTSSPPEPVAPATAPAPSFRCIHCGSTRAPVARKIDTPKGALVKIIFFFFYWPIVFFFPFLKEDEFSQVEHRCADCGIRLG
jgi:hypothetical protein